MIDGDPYDPKTWLATQFQAPDRYAAVAVKQDERSAVFRRLALAYASHGRPLPYRYTNPAAVKDQLVYLRAVDTAGLPPLPGSGATANKILVSLVNFSRQPQVVEARVTMPREGVYTGIRFGAEPQYLAARSSVQLVAAPAADFAENLGPGEAVQFTLEFAATLAAKDVPPRPAPSPLDKVEAGSVGEIGFARLTWTPQANLESTTIRVQRAEDGERWIEVGTAPALAGRFEDARKSGPERGREYQYRIRTANAAGDGPPSTPVRVRIP